MTSPTDHVDVAAYVLGALDESENAAFERHLATCPRCQAELNELSSLPSLLDQVRGSGLLADLLGDDLAGPAHGSVNPNQGLSTPPPMLGNANPFPSGPPAPTGPRHGPRTPMSGLPDLSDFRPAPPLPAPPRSKDKVLQGVMVDIADARRRRRRTGLLAAAAAAVLIVGGPLLTLGLTGAFSGPAETVQASNGPVSATIGLTGDDHGTRVSFDLTGVRGPLDCTLYTVSKDGKTKRPLGSWTVDAKGYGTAENSAALHIDGNTSIPLADLGRLEFAREGGPDILDVNL